MAKEFKPKVGVTPTGALVRLPKEYIDVKCGGLTTHEMNANGRLYAPGSMDKLVHDWKPSKELQDLLDNPPKYTLGVLDGKACIYEEGKWPRGFSPVVTTDTLGRTGVMYTKESLEKLVGQHLHLSKNDLVVLSALTKPEELNVSVRSFGAPTKEPHEGYFHVVTVDFPKD